MSQELPIHIRVVKSQELERQAMEQYRSSNAMDEKQSDSGSVSYKDKDCFDGRRCSEYGQCSPSRGTQEKKGKCLAIRSIHFLKKIRRYLA